MDNIQNTVILIQSVDSIKLQRQQTTDHVKIIQIQKTLDQAPPNLLQNVFSDSKKIQPKEDYQKNITINVVKCCIREMISLRYSLKMKRVCAKKNVHFHDLVKFAQPILKQVVLSMGDLKQLLTEGNKASLKVKQIFAKFLEWYIRHKYLQYLVAQGKMSFKERYIEYKNKYVLYLLEQIRQSLRQEEAKKEADKTQKEKIKSNDS